MEDVFSLKNKTIVISGASSGIGKSCAEVFSKLGARLILLGRNLETLEKVQNTLQNPNSHLSFETDITSEDEVKIWIKNLIDANIKIDGLLHSAGIKHTLPFKNTSEKILIDSFSVNVFAGLYLAKAVSQKKIRNEKLSIVFISSIAGVVGESANTVYSATKGALISGTKSLALELSKQNTRINCISPAIIKTALTENMFSQIGETAAQNILDKHPLGVGKPEDVAHAAVFLLSEASRWITGSNLIVDGGFSAH